MTKKGVKIWSVKKKRILMAVIARMIRVPEKGFAVSAFGIMCKAANCLPAAFQRTRNGHTIDPFRILHVW